MSKEIARELLAVARELMASEAAAEVKRGNWTFAELIEVRMRASIEDSMVTAAEMEKYCPDCARQIRAGELEMTRLELNELLTGHQETTMESRVAARFRKASWMTELEAFYGRNANYTKKDSDRIYAMGDKAWAKFGNDHKALRNYTRDLAAQMAKSIKHADKAYRRGRAAENENYHTEAAIFFDRAEELWRAMPRTARVAAKWETLPKGWTDESRKKFWDTLTGGAKHKVTKCIKEMEGKFDNPGAFCASLADRVDPGWRSKK